MLNQPQKPLPSPGSGPLEGLRILDLTRILAGPWATQVLSDLGAEVIKVERPGSGDDTRSWGPPYLKDSKGRACGAAYFHAANRGKASIDVDISHPEGQEIVRSLAAKSDVVIENFKVGGLNRYGLDHKSLAKIKPDLIYCSITGFGQTGPYAKKAGYDFLIQALGGLMSVTGRPDNDQGGEPMKVGVALTDVLTGLYAAIGILSAIRHRDRTGEGQYIDLALLDVQVATLANQALNFLAGGVTPQRMGNSHPNIVPYQAFRVSDGHIIVAVGNDTQFARFCDVIDRPDLAQNPQFSTNPSRVKNRASLLEHLNKALKRKDIETWVTAFAKAGVPAGPINDIAGVFDDPQVKARGLEIQPVTPDEATTRGVSSPIRLSSVQQGSTKAAPSLGADSDDILGRILGLDAKTRQGLRDRGAIGQTTPSVGASESGAS